MGVRAGRLRLLEQAVLDVDPAARGGDAEVDAGLDADLEQRHPPLGVLKGGIRAEQRRAEHLEVEAPVEPGGLDLVVLHVELEQQPTVEVDRGQSDSRLDVGAQVDGAEAARPELGVDTRDVAEDVDAALQLQVVRVGRYVDIELEDRLLEGDGTADREGADADVGLELEVRRLLWRRQRQRGLHLDRDGDRPADLPVEVDRKAGGDLAAADGAPGGRERQLHRVRGKQALAAEVDGHPLPRRGRLLAGGASNCEVEAGVRLGDAGGEADLRPGGDTDRRAPPLGQRHIRVEREVRTRSDPDAHLERADAEIWDPEGSVDLAAWRPGHVDAGGDDRATGAERDLGHERGLRRNG